MFPTLEYQTKKIAVFSPYFLSLYKSNLVQKSLILLNEKGGSIRLGVGFSTSDGGEALPPLPHTHPPRPCVPSTLHYGLTKFLLAARN